MEVLFFGLPYSTSAVTWPIVCTSCPEYPHNGFPSYDLSGLLSVNNVFHCCSDMTDTAQGVGHDVVNDVIECMCLWKIKYFEFFSENGRPFFI